MISNDDIGNLGRLGNQMFQYAALRGLAAKHRYDYCLPPKNYVGLKDPNCANSDTNIFECFRLKEVDRLITNFPIYSESSFEFDNNLWEKCLDKINLFGYFQSEKYFKHIESEIRKDFRFREDIIDVCNKKFNDLFSEKDVISIHIRRGDYLINPNHPPQDLEYYKKSLSFFDDNIPVIIFSDDPKWCKEQQIFESDRFLISERNNSEIDLCLMSMCSYHIIANSSFSWWGAWLANSKKVISPKKWFSGDSKKHKTKDLYCSNWIII